MANVSVFNMAGKEVDKLELNDAVFAAPINEHLVHMAVVQQLANKRQGTQSAKTRSEVSGGGRKPWRQKGTGHARQGSTRSPQWTGGGVVFAPKPRDYSMKMNKREKAMAIKSALTTNGIDNNLVISSKNIPTVRTSSIEVLKAEDKREVRSTINVYDIMKYDTLVVTKDAVAAIEEVYA